MSDESHVDEDGNEWQSDYVREEAAKMMLRNLDAAFNIAREHGARKHANVLGFIFLASKYNHTEALDKVHDFMEKIIQKDRDSIFRTVLGRHMKVEEVTGKIAEDILKMLQKHIQEQTGIDLDKYREIRDQIGYETMEMEVRKDHPKMAEDILKMLGKKEGE